MNLVQKVELAIEQAKTPTDKAWAALAVMQAHNRAHPVSSPPQNDAGVEGLREAVEAVKNCRDIAMRCCVTARAPECGEFAAIAQDLDAALPALTPLSEPQALGQEFEAGWRPIETAPKDDEPRLVRGRDWGMPNGRIHYNVAIWNHVFNEWRSADEPEQALAYLTDWLPGTPLPSAPSGEG